MNQAPLRANLGRTDEINLIDLAHKLLVRWPIIVVCMALTLLAGILTLRYSTYTYTAELKVTAVQNNAQGALSSLGQLGGLASLVGVSLPRSESTPFFLYVESVKSRAVADELAANPDLMKHIFKNEWDPQANRFMDRPTWLESTANSLRKMVGIPVFPWSPPDGARLQLHLVDNVDVIEDTRKPIVTLRYENEDPAFAAALLTALDRTIDNQLRQKTLARVNENMAYLSQQLATVRLAEHRQAIIDMLSEQEKTRMMASSNAPVAAETVSGPTPSYRPTRPRQLLVLAAALLAGLCLGGILALMWDWFTRHPSDGGVRVVPSSFVERRQGVAGDPSG